MSEKKSWDVVIKPKKRLLRFDYKELWRYKDLILLFVRRDFVSVYKQTVLGPLWFIIQPVLMTITFTIVFSLIAKLSTNNLPPVAFYMSGIVPWMYFSGCLLKTSNTFIANIAIFGKVYFPRLTVPISTVISTFISFGIQMMLILLMLLYYTVFSEEYAPEPNWYMLFIPVLVVMMALLGLGAGIIISAMTTKYRDLKFLVGFGTQLLMYASTVIFPLSSVDGKLKYIILANPMSSIIEAFRYALFGGAAGEINFWHLGYSFGVILLILFIGIIMFNRVEKSFADTV